MKRSTQPSLATTLCRTLLATHGDGAHRFDPDELCLLAAVCATALPAPNRVPPALVAPLATAYAKLGLGPRPERSALCSAVARRLSTGGLSAELLGALDAIKTEMTTECPL